MLENRTTSQAGAPAARAPVQAVRAGTLAAREEITKAKAGTVRITNNKDGSKVRIAKMVSLLLSYVLPHIHPVFIEQTCRG